MNPSTPRISPKRRRSKRLGLSVAVFVYGKNVSGKPFRELASTISVSANGGLVALAATVQEGQTILVQNKSTLQEQECRVVHVRSTADEKWAVGIAFTQVAADFWQISFPPSVSGRAAYAGDSYPNRTASLKGSSPA